MKQEETPKPRKVRHLYPDMRNLRLLPRHKSLSPVEGRDVVWSVKVKAIPSVGGLLPNVRGSWLDAETWLMKAAIQSAVPT